MVKCLLSRFGRPTNSRAQQGDVEMKSEEEDNSVTNGQESVTPCANNNSSSSRPKTRSNGVRQQHQQPTNHSKKMHLRKSKPTGTNLESACMSSGEQQQQRSSKRKLDSASSALNRGANGWEDSLRPRPPQVQQFQIIQARQRVEKVKEVNNKELNNKPVKKFKPTKYNSTFAEYTDGHVVWAKFGVSRWWPAVILSGSDCAQQPARENHSWCVWFGDYKISELPKDRYEDFTTQFKSKFSSSMGKAYMNSVNEAIEMCRVRCNTNLEGDNSEKLLIWAREGFPRDTEGENPSVPDPDHPIPEVIRFHLRKIRSSVYQRPIGASLLENETTPTQLDELSSPSKPTSVSAKASAFDEVRRGVTKIQDICIACDAFDCEITDQHPIFEGGLCASCKEHVIDTMFAYGDDGTNSYCCICASPGELIICDNGDCSRVYCSTCIEHFVGIGCYDDVLEKNPWLCYFCEPYDSKRNGLIRKKDDWQSNILKLFKPEKHFQLDTGDIVAEKRPIRVLSLFDGIGTGKLCLDQLGIEVEIYYASEIDQDSMNVSSVQHFGNITQLGPVETLSDAEIAKLCPIDLVIGGSPCNDLSLVNPQRKGLYDPSGTGTLFFDFYRMLKAVQLGNNGHFLFWLFENVASMPLDYRAIISRFLQCDPAMIDSKHFSPQNRARYFWGNIPGLHSPLTPYLMEQNIVLQDYVSSCRDRTAVVEKVRTITTKTNSLKQGKNAIYPIQMNGVGDVLWVTELESHYTDTGNLNIGRRHQLLGKAWSVQVIKHIFAPLKNFFKLKSESKLSADPPALKDAPNGSLSSVVACQS